MLSPVRPPLTVNTVRITHILPIAPDEDSRSLSHSSVVATPVLHFASQHSHTLSFLHTDTKEHSHPSIHQEPNRSDAARSPAIDERDETSRESRTAVVGYNWMQHDEISDIASTAPPPYQ